MGYLCSVLVLVFLLALPAHAKTVKSLGEFTEQQVVILDKAVNESAATGGRESETRDWAFKRFLLRVTAKVGFSIEVVNLDLIPELELVWQKESGI